MRRGLPFLIVVFLLLPQGVFAAVTLIPGVSVRFAGIREGKGVLEAWDDYARSLNGFDAAVRMRTTAPVTAADYLRFAGESVRGWTPAERKRLARVIREVRPHLSGYSLPLPSTVLLVKTDGREEAGAPYTRLNAVILPAGVLKKKPAELRHILVHELFHVLSRHNPELRDRLYAVIGFRRCEVRLPEELVRLRISNPDHPQYLHAVELELPGGKGEAVPVLLSRYPEFDPRIPGNFFDYMKFCLLVVERRGESCLPVERAGRPLLLEPEAVPAYRERVGWNTDYINSAEEALADNFVVLVLGRKDIPSP
ncbi:MAG TPA: hypothetical protein VNX25_01885, partial [Verrucomicrobiae bacterium]|nr:hypothetical protein [Verrucomicrobiae bacterium]